jgi:hypothetical protein
MDNSKGSGFTTKKPTANWNFNGEDYWIRMDITNAVEETEPQDLDYAHGEK